MAPRTPSPVAEEIQAPAAPRFGYHDSWKPYPQTQTRSTRSTSQRNRTPSPPRSRSKALSSPRAARKADNQGDAAIVSPVLSPRKKRVAPANPSHSSMSGKLTVEGIANAAASLPPPMSDPFYTTNSSSNTAAMLPTPSKTPSKPPTEMKATEIQTFARNLFHGNDAGLKKRAKKYHGLGMDSFTAEPADDPIEIFTDTKDSVPEIDNSKANPFYGNAKEQESETSPRRSRRRQIVIPGEGAQSIDEATRREDGMVYVFRGKKFYRKFTDDAAEEEESEAGQGLSRLSVKPRLLFPPKASKASIEDEEATTDVEDNVMKRSAARIPQTPTKSHKENAKTPEAPRHAPVSPPETRRTTRSTNKFAGDETPIKPQLKRRPSLFDSWPRTKEHKAPSSKRTGEGLASAPAKRTRA